MADFVEMKCSCCHLTADFANQFRNREMPSSAKFILFSWIRGISIFFCSPCNDWTHGTHDAYRIPTALVTLNEHFITVERLPLHLYLARHLVIIQSESRPHLYRIK